MAQRVESDSYYALEKLGAAIDELAVGEGDVRTRLEAACISIAAVSEDDFPESLRKDFKNIVEALTKHPGRHRQEGAVHRTLARMRNSTGSKIARRILDLESRLDGFVRESERSK